MWDRGACPRQVTLLSPTVQTLVLDVQKVHYLDASHTSHTVQEMARFSVDGDVQAVILGDDERWTVQSRTFTTLRGRDYPCFSGRGS